MLYGIDRLPGCLSDMIGDCMHLKLVAIRVAVSFASLHNCMRPSSTLPLLFLAYGPHPAGLSEANYRIYRIMSWLLIPSAMTRAHVEGHATGERGLARAVAVPPSSPLTDMASSTRSRSLESVPNGLADESAALGDWSSK